MRTNAMKVLWLCNIVLNDFAEVYNIKKKPFGGWMEGMLHAFDKGEVEFALCFPINDENRMRNGFFHGCKYYSFHSVMDSGDYDHRWTEEFIRILEDYNPDVVHVWGTEYNHARNMVEACGTLGITSKVLIHIQGLITYYSIHYLDGIPEKYINLKNGKHLTLLEEKQNFERRGENERTIFRMIDHVVDCSRWGERCTHLLNKEASFYFCQDILRDAFYECDRHWEYNNCEKQSIFMSQASYPIKGLHYLLKAVSLVKREFKDVKLRIAGYSPMLPDQDGYISGYGTYLYDLLKAYELENSIEFLGLMSTEQMIDRYLSCNVFISPSTIEDPSNSICEAQILGVPVLASAVGGAVDILDCQTMDNAYPCDEWYILAEKIMYIFRCGDECDFINSIDKIRKNAWNRHDRKKVKDVMLKIYGDIASIDDNYMIVGE